MRVRKATLADYKGIAKVHVDSWKTSYRGIVPDEYLDNLTYEARESLWKEQLGNDRTVYIAENEEGDVVGFANGGKERSGKYPEYDGELYSIYILKEYQQRGLGKKLLQPIVQDLINDNITTMLVLVITDNPSKHFYESLNGKEIDQLTFEISSKTLLESVYGWRDIREIQF